MRFYLAFISAQLTLSSLAAGNNPFLDAGIPTADREWRGSDYMLAADIFTARKVALPRFSDMQGSLLLERLTSPENFAFHRNRTLPFASRIEDLLKLQQGANTISKLYLATATKGDYAHKETARLAAFMLHTAALTIELMDEFIPTIQKDDKYAIRMDGLNKMYSGLTTMFVGAEVSLSEQKIYSPEDLSTLLEAMTTTLPRIKRAFTTDYRTELRKKLQTHKSKFKSRDDVRRIETMLRELGD